MKRLSTLLCGTALTLALTGGAFAANVTKTITFEKPVQVNGTTLKAGDYKVSYDDASPNTQVTFKQGKKEVATAQAQVKPLGGKTVNTEVVYSGDGSSRNIQEIHFGGSTQTLVLSDNGNSSQSGQ
jgi:hypothetical protein